MEVEYLRELRQNYLMIETEGREEQSYAARMLLGNTIEGLLKFRIKKADNRSKFCYEITSKQPLSRMLEKRAVNKEQIRRLLLGIVLTLSRMEDYLLAEEQILLDPDYIYVDPEEYQPFLCLIPGKKGNFPEEFSLLLQFLLGKADHEDKEAVVLIYGLYRESLKENYGIDNLLQWLMREDCPNMEYGNGMEKCEKINTENIESWEKEDRIPKESEMVPEVLLSEEKPGYIYFLPGIAMILLAVGFRFFSGRYRLVQYSIWLAAAGVMLLTAVGFLKGWRFFAEQKKYQEKKSVRAPYDSLSNSQISYEKALIHTSSNSRLFHEQTSFRETSIETSELNPFISNKKSQLKTPVQPGQWQMIFEEPEEENTEISMPEDSGRDELCTVLLWDQSQEKTVRSLVSQDGESDILLSYYPFIIGKQKGLCDHVIDKSTVSRLHVRIDETEAGYQITDLNSTNGTFVNGKALDANGTAQIQPGDEIGVADLRFQLK